MKIIAIIFALACSLSANAGLITTQSDQTNYNTNDIVLVDFFVNSANSDIDWLALDFNFDSTKFSFVSFTETIDVINNAYYAFGAYTIGDTLVNELGLNYGWSDNLGTSFKWGQAQFTAITDTKSPVFNIENVIAIDSAAQDIDAQAVPEPSTLALFSLIAGFLLLRKRNNV